jgi:hypothetical protein
LAVHACVTAAEVRRLIRWMAKPDYVDEACVVLVRIPLVGGSDEQLTYVVGCPSPEEAIILIREEHAASNPGAKIIASRLTQNDTKGFKLKPREIRPW